MGLLSFRFDHPELLWLLLLALPIVWLGRRSLATLEPFRRWTAMGLRLAVLLVLVLMLAGLQSVRTHSDLTVMAVVDRSESVRRFVTPPANAMDPTNPAAVATRPSVEQWVTSFLKRASDDRRDDDRIGLITFDGQATVQAMPRAAVDLDAAAIGAPKDGTDTASALRTAMALFPPDSGARLVLVGDANDTQGDASLLAAAREAAAANIPIDVVPLAYRVDNEVMVDAVYAPTQARQGRTVAVRVALRAVRPTRGQLLIEHNGQLLDVNGQAPGAGAAIDESDWVIEKRDDLPDLADLTDAESAADSSPMGDYVCVKQLELPIAYAGAQRWEAIFEPADGVDQVVANNKAQAFTLVSGKGRILLVDNVGGTSGQILANALQSHGVDTDIVPPGAIPSRLSALQRYDAVLFQNVPADMVASRLQRNISKYVNNLGGGFAMIGGPDSFGAGGWTNSPIDRILPVNCQIPSQTILPSGALVLVIDRSGSMGAPVGGSAKTQIELASEAGVLALSTLYPQDLVGVVAFDGSSHLIVDIKLNTDPADTAKRLRSLSPGGGTNIYSGLQMAYEKLAALKTGKNAIKHMILLTDGNSTPPPGGSYVQLAQRMAASGISLSTVGVGDGHDAQLLTQLANMANGQYHPVTNPNKLPQVFIKEAKTIRKNLIREQDFAPKMVNAGSPITSQMPTPPQLKGLVLTGEKSDPRVFTPMLGPEGEPLFAHWQVGLGRAAAFTSDAHNRWATSWLNWPGYADFWVRTVRNISRPSQARNVDLVTSIEGNRLRLRVDAAGEEDGSQRRDAGFGNFLNIKGGVLGPDGEVVDVDLHQVGPGIYEAEIEADQPGSYIASLFVQQPDGERVAAFGGVNRPPGAELRRFASDVNLLQQVAQITGGRVLDPNNPDPIAAGQGLFARTSAFESRSMRPLWRHLLIWLLVLVWLDVASRRIAWDPVAIYGWAKGKVGSVAGGMRTRKVESEQTLSSLRNVRDRTRASINGTDESATGAAAVLAKSRRAGGDQTPSSADDNVPATSSKRKFEADPDAQAHENLADAIGGAGQTGSANADLQRIRQQQAKRQAEDESTTSRLLAARKRVADQVDDEPQSDTDS